MTKTLQNLYFQFHTFGDDMLEKEKHKHGQKEFLNNSDFILKRAQELQVFEKNILWRAVVHHSNITLSENFIEMPDCDDTCLSSFHVTTGWGDLSPHLRNPGLPDDIGVKYFSYWNHSDLQRMYTEVPLLQTQYN